MEEEGVKEGEGGMKKGEDAGGLWGTRRVWEVAIGESGG